VNSKQRFLATVRGERADKIPVYHLQFSGHAASVILGREEVCVGGAHNLWLEMNALWRGEDAHAEYGARCETDAMAITEACGMDLLRLGYWRWGGGRPTQKVDDRTFLFGDPEGDWFTMTYDPKVELFKRAASGAGSGSGQPAPELDEGAFTREVEELEAQAAGCEVWTGPEEGLKAAIDKHSDYLVRHGGGTVCIGLESARQLMAVALWPELFARLMMARAQILAAHVPALAAAGLDVNISGEDFCSARGPCISPETFARVITPALKLLVDATHAAGMYYFYSSDGNFWPVADEIFIGAGIDGWMETDRSAGMDLRRLRGTVDDVRREVNDCLQVAHDLGRIVVGASNMIMPGTLPENIHAMLSESEKGR